MLQGMTKEEYLKYLESPYSPEGNMLRMAAKEFEEWKKNATYLGKVWYMVSKRIRIFIKAFRISFWYGFAEEIVDHWQRKYRIEIEWRVLKILSRVIKNPDKILGKEGPTTFRECLLYVLICKKIIKKRL